MRDLEKKREYNRQYARTHTREATTRMKHWRIKPENKHKERKRYYSERYSRTRVKYLALRRLRKYGLTQEEYDAKIAAQNNTCTICNKQMVVPHIDHNHETGKNRDLLCKNCNTGLGMFLEDVSILESAIEYIKRHNQIVQGS